MKGQPTTTRLSRAPAPLRASASTASWSSTAAPTVGVVVIGRNEAARLEDCLRSVRRVSSHVVYVDSVSTDDSVAIAQRMNVDVLELDNTTPMSAARGRNEGLEYLREHVANLEFVQFIDGDCVLDAEWLAAAADRLVRRAGVAVVCGRLRERDPSASVYQALCDLEWDGPAGPIDHCGGVCLARVRALTDVGGFATDLPAGEEPEMCWRLRGRGWQIERYDLPMAVHDAQMTRFSQWWRRQVRGGRGALDVLIRTRRRGARPVYQRQVFSTLAWTVGWLTLLAMSIVALIVTGNLWTIAATVLVAALPIAQAARIAWRTRRHGQSWKVAAAHGGLTMLGKWAQLVGFTRIHKHTKTQPNDRARPAVAYLNTCYPSVSHTFIENEIQAVRRNGVDVYTFSVRRPSAAHLNCEANRAAAKRTTYLLDGVGSLLGALCGGLLRPVALVRAFVAAQRLSPPGFTQRLKHAAYTLEAIRLARGMARHDLRHVHVHMANNGAAVALIAGAFDRRLDYSLTIHGSAEFFIVDSGRLREKVERAAWVRCISDFCKSQVMAWSSPAAWERIHVVPCGIDLDVFAPPRRTKPRRQDEPMRLLAVGRLTPIKGYSLLLDACEQLTARGVDWRLSLVGDGEQRAALERKADEMREPKRVTFHGFVSHDAMAEHYAAADVFVVSSFMEGVPVVMMEAMAGGLPVVGTQVGGIPELIAPGVTGELSPPGSPARLAESLERVARRLASYDGEAARRRIVEHHNVDKTGRAMAALLSQHVRDTAPAPMKPQTAPHRPAVQGHGDVVAAA